MCILSHCPPLIKRVAHQLQSGVTLRNKTQERKKKNPTKQKQTPQSHILYHKYAAHKANSVSGTVIK